MTLPNLRILPTCLPLVLGSLLLLAAPSAATAQTYVPAEGFFSPSGNIICGFPEGTGPEFRCEMIEAEWEPEGRPQDCDLDLVPWVAMTAEGPAGTGWDCRGDTWVSEKMQPLDYGRSWEMGGISCDSTTEGITCSNGGGKGWSINRRSASLF